MTPLLNPSKTRAEIMMGKNKIKKQKQVVHFVFPHYSLITNICPVSFSSPLTSDRWSRTSLVIVLTLIRTLYY